MASRVASLVPFYDYDEARFFSADGAPDIVAAERRADFAQLAELVSDAVRAYAATHRRCHRI
jgi:glutamate-1-semialdehyde 2,1-aminomutase